MNKVTALATGIGSMPHTDADQAMDLIFRYAPQAPFWPQLPRRDVRERMTEQFSQNLPCLSITASGLRFDPKDKEGQLERFYERIIGHDLGYFGLSGDYALGLHKFIARLKTLDLKGIEFIKCHITGPFTFAASVADENGVALLHDEVFMQVILKGLMMKALWQIGLFKAFGKPVILFIDEPYLGCFGSAFTPLSREDVVGGLSEFCAGIKSEGVLLGVHCCGNTDWSIFTDVEKLDIINFDAFGFLDKLILYSEGLKAFLNRGGILCWGIVPTREFADATAQALAKRIGGGINRLGDKGLDKDLLRERLFLSPACGLGTLGTKDAESILRLLSETSAFIRSSPV